jgi:hypothetical protein
MITYNPIGTIRTEEEDKILNVLLEERHKDIVMFEFAQTNRFILTSSDVIKLRELLDQAISAMNQ